MDFADGPAEAAFRTGLRDWLAANLPAGWADRDPRPGRLDVELARDWTRRLHAAGYTGLTWPAAYGGRGLSPVFEGIYLEESARVDAPEHVGVIGLGMAGPTILAHGTEQQRRDFCPPILSGELIFCQGFSEPEAGSDLAGLRTRARRDGDHYVVDGQKVWSSYAHLADWCLLLARSEDGAERHAGLTYLLADMHAPGVEVRPLRQITGAAEFNEIFFTGVRVPAGNVLGRPGDGWRVAMTTLQHERATLGFALTAALDRLLRRLVATARSTGATGDPWVRDRLAALWVDLAALRFTNYRAVTALLRTGSPGPEGSVAKLHWSQANQRLTTLARELLGEGGQLDGPDAHWSGFWAYQQLRSRGNTIEAGTSEIQRSIIAERVLGLPRSR